MNDYMSIGQSLCESILDYIQLKDNPIKLNELIMDMTSSLMQQKHSENAGEAKCSTKNSKLEHESHESFHCATSPENTVDNHTSQISESQTPHSGLQGESLSLKELAPETLQRCCDLLSSFATLPMDESNSSEDSNSESEPEVVVYYPQKKKKKQKAISTLKSAFIHSSPKTEPQSKPNHQVALKAYPLFVNRYANRTNGGIPIFAQERLLERAAKRREQMKVVPAEQNQLDLQFMVDNHNFRQISMISHPFCFNIQQEDSLYTRRQPALTSVPLDTTLAEGSAKPDTGHPSAAKERSFIKQRTFNQPPPVLLRFKTRSNNQPRATHKGQYS
nr:PREDICTED: uncharacterized protein LOC102352964 [Latimeria chalumnae]|eukprot:XP_006004787.2 PREDICTED: uncharacterized protein LOC102352964 [Latimeria chalumnae]